MGQSGLGTNYVQSNYGTNIWRVAKIGWGGGRGEQAPATNYNQSNCNSVLQATIEGEGRMSRETSNLCHKLINHCDSHCGG